MIFKDTRKKYLKLKPDYKNMSETKRRIERAHYKFEVDAYPAWGLYLTLIALVIDKMFPDSYIKIFSFFFCAVVAIWIGIEIRYASIHISVIDDVEKELEKESKLKVSA